MNKINRVILIVLDSVGIGELPDAAEYNDTGSNTLGNIARLHLGFSIPNLVAMGLGNIDPQNEIPSAQNPTAFYGKANEQSAGKDTTTGHWEISGLILEKPFPTFPNGFPESFIKEYSELDKAEGFEDLDEFVQSLDRPRRYRFRVVSPVDQAMVLTFQIR